MYQFDFISYIRSSSYSHDRAHGVKFLFTLAGGHIAPILTASEQEGIRVIDVRHEVTTVFAADAVARLTGVPGVAAVTAGPGVTNTITAVKNAQMAQSPLILLGGAAATLLKGKGSLQDIDQMAVLQPIVKYAVACTTVREIVPAMRRAFQEAASGVPGPVYVELPLDILYSVKEFRSGAGLSTSRKVRDLKAEEHGSVIIPQELRTTGSREEDLKAYVNSLLQNQSVELNTVAKQMPWVITQYMRYKVYDIYNQGFAETEFGPLPVEVPTPTKAEIDVALNLLLSAKNPVLVLGSQSTLGAQTIDELAQAVEAFGLPTFLGGMARGLLGKNNKYHIRQGRGLALKRADVVILAGAVCDFRMDYGRTLNPNH